MNTTQIRTRFAPSPTGNLHIGGARTALFCYLWAKKHSGQFLLRIEDTDQEREKEGALQSILDGMRWLNMNWDEGPEVGGEYGPYFQSQRLDIYKKYAHILIEKQKAYYCFCTQERLEQMRKDQQEKKLPPRYDRHCRFLSAEQIKEHKDAGIPHVIRLAVPEEGELVITDSIRGEITFDLRGIDDQVLMKSDGYPTYHLANVVDDYTMKITHVIRGEDWLPSTPKHILLYQFFEWPAPEFTHLTLFLSKQGGKMSKRHGETSLMAFRDKGYLPEAIVNFIALLGWNPKTEEEFFTLNELIERFDIAKINAANPVFETEKLDWMNQQYLRKFSVQQLIEAIQELSTKSTEYTDVYTNFVQWFSAFSNEKQESIWSSVQERATTLLEVAQSNQCVNAVLEYDPVVLIWKKSDKQKTLAIIAELIAVLESIPNEQYISKKLEEVLLPWIKEKGWGNGDVLWPMRYALSGEQKSPSPFELAELLQKEKTIERLQLAKSQLESASS